jgi:APA family basic amino acid/polyamine antiporter
LLHPRGAEENRLRRVLGPVTLTALGIGAIIGAGIFITTGRVAREDAGPSIVLSYSVAGLGCARAALCYAELASMVPLAGSAYTYAYATMGELFAWIIGWDLILEYAMSCAIVASGWSGHLDEFLQVAFGRGLPTAIASDPFSLPGAWLNLPAVLIMAVLTLILVLGIRQSATTNAVLVLTKLAVVCFVIVAGWSYSNPANWTDIPLASRVPPEGQAQKWGILGLLGLHHWLLPLDDPIHSRSRRMACRE